MRLKLTIVGVRTHTTLTVHLFALVILGSVIRIHTQNITCGDFNIPKIIENVQSTLKNQTVLNIMSPLKMWYSIHLFHHFSIVQGAY